MAKIIKGKLPVTWISNDYEGLSYTPHPDPNRGFVLRSGDSHQLEKAPLETCRDVPANILQNITKLKLRNMSYAIQKYYLNSYLPWHKDTYTTYRKHNKLEKDETVFRIILFLHDSVPGQQLWIDQELCYGSAGDYFGWSEDSWHMAANLCNEHRYNLQITGIAPRQ